MALATHARPYIVQIHSLLAGVQDIAAASKAVEASDQDDNKEAEASENAQDEVDLRRASHHSAGMVQSPAKHLEFLLY